MASIQRRKGRASPYRVRYIDPEGVERSRSFRLKRDAEDFLVSTSHRIRTGEYVNPDAGRVTFRQYAEDWRLRQLHKPGTASSYETRLRLHAYPVLGDRPLAALRRDELERWQVQLVDSMAGSTAAAVRAAVGTVLAAAVKDRRIHENPLDEVARPKVARTLVRPIGLAQVQTLHAELLPRYQAIVPLISGSGLRAGEALGLTLDNLDLDALRVDVVQQLKGRRAGGEPIFGSPKTEKSVRTVPIAELTAQRLREHIAAYPGRFGLVFTTSRGGAVTRGVFGKTWQPAARAAGLPEGDGLHVLRHFYASMLIQAGASVKEVQARLGHATAMETLDVYAHLWPDDEDRTRAAVERMLGGS